MVRQITVRLRCWRLCRNKRTCVLGITWLATVTHQLRVVFYQINRNIFTVFLCLWLLRPVTGISRILPVLNNILTVQKTLVNFMNRLVCAYIPVSLLRNLSYFFLGTFQVFFLFAYFKPTETLGFLLTLLDFVL